MGLFLTANRENTMRTPRLEFITAALAATILIPAAASATPAVVGDWVYGAGTIEPFAAVVPFANGDYLLAGSSDSIPTVNKKTADKHGLLDYWVVRRAPDGTQIWDKSFGGLGWDELHSAVATSDGGFLLAGWSNSGISGNKGLPNFNNSADIWIVKIDANGVKQWERVFGGTNSDSAMELVVSGQYVYVVGMSDSGVGGNKTSPGQGSTDYWVVKMYASTGAKIWDRTFGGLDVDNLSGAEATASGGLLLVGYSFSGIGGNKTAPLHGGCDYWLVSIDGNGNKLWDRTYGGPGEDAGRDALATPYGFIVFGDSPLTPAVSYGDQDYWVLKIDATGNLLDDAHYGGPGDEWGARLLASPNTSGQRYILGGYSRSSPGGSKTAPHQGDYDGWLVEITDSTLAQGWDVSFGGTGADVLADLIRTPNGLLAGLSSQSPVSGDKTAANNGPLDDFWIVGLQ
jgi:hypothetical protein